LANLIRSDTGGVSQIIFIVRNDAGHSDMLYQTSDKRAPRLRRGKSVRNTRVDRTQPALQGRLQSPVQYLGNYLDFRR
jgi:hypothetical protein